MFSSVSFKSRLITGFSILQILFICLISLQTAYSQGLWVPKAPIGNSSASERAWACGFEAGGKGYVGGGTVPGWKNAYVSSNDFFQYDASNDSWESASAFTGASRYGAITFTLNGKGYMCCGINAAATNGSMNPATVSTYLKDVWQFDPSTNAWTQKANLGTLGRFSGAAFVIGSFAYVGTGASDNAPFYRSDLNRYDPATNTWSAMASLPSLQACYGAAAFSINAKGYIVGGNRSGSPGVTNEVWEYNPATNGWTQKINFTGTARGGASGFATATKGYMMGGSNSTQSSQYADCWEYNPTTDAWLQKTSAPFSLCNNASFVLNGEGYFAGGYYNTLNSDKLISYNPSTNLWTTRKAMGNSGRLRSQMLSYNGKLFVGSGTFGDRSYNVITLATFRRDNWWYDPLTNSWSAADSLPANITNAGSFIIDSSIFIVGGLNPSHVAVNDNWEYNTATHVWTQRASFPGTQPRIGPASMTISNRGFYGMGIYAPGNAYFNDWWEYQKSSNTWISRSTTASMIGRYNAMTFTVKGKGYIVGGITLNATNCETWEYNPVTDVWTKRADLSSESRNAGAGFSILNKGYVSCGWKQLVNTVSPSSHNRDLWEYDPVSNVWAAKTAPPFLYGREGNSGAGIAGKGYLFGGMELAATSGSTNISYYYKSDLHEYTPDNIFSFPDDTIYCAAATVTVNYTTQALTFNAGNILTLQLSNASGSFASPVAIGTLTTTALSGVITGTIPAAQIAGGNYRLRIVSSNFADIGDDNGVNIAVSRTPLSISSFSPTSGYPNDSITIAGTNFYGTRLVQFNGITAGFRVISNTQIKTAVPPLASTGKIMVITGCGNILSSADFTVPAFTFPVKVFLESFYDGQQEMIPYLYQTSVSADTNAVDTLVLRVHQNTAPYTIGLSITAILKKDGTALFTLPGGYRYGTFYLVVKHKHSLETWSKLPVIITGTPGFDFTVE